MSNKINQWARENLEREYTQVLSENRDIRKQRDILLNKLNKENKSHNYHCKESQRKNDVIYKLEHQNKMLVEALEFYANEDNWDNYLINEPLQCIDESDYYYHPMSFTNGIGGKRAREAFDKIKELDNE